MPLGGAARQFAPDDFDDFDYVLAMDRANRRGAARLARDARDRARIAFCGRSTRQRPPDAEVPDPYYGGPGGFDEVFDICERACRGLLDQLTRELGASRDPSRA